MPSTTARAGRSSAARPARVVAAATIVTLGALAVRYHSPHFPTAQAASTTAESTTTSSLPAMGERVALLRLLDCRVRSTFDVRSPALEGFTCRAASGSITVFRFPTAPPDADVEHKRGRACHYATRVGRDEAWIAVGGDWLGWSLHESTLAGLADDVATVSTIDCGAL